MGLFDEGVASTKPVGELATCGAMQMQCVHRRTTRGHNATTNQAKKSKASKAKATRKQLAG